MGFKEKEKEETKRRRSRQRERKRERDGCKRHFCLLLAPRSPQEKFPAIPNLGNKPTKVNWTLSWSGGMKICSGYVFLKILSRFKTILDPLFEVGTCFCKGSFFLLAQDHLVNSFCNSQTWATSPLNWTGPSHGLVAWKCVRVLFLKKCWIGYWILWERQTSIMFFSETKA